MQGGHPATSQQDHSTINQASWPAIHKAGWPTIHKAGWPTIAACRGWLAAISARVGWLRVANHPEWLLGLLAVFWTLALNQGFLGFAIRSLDLPGLERLRFAVWLTLSVAALHWLILLAIAHRWTWRPAMVLLLPAAASAAWFIDRYGIHIDPSMVRNVLRTDAAEARELLGPGLALQILLYAVLPLLVLWSVPNPARSRLRASASRLAYLGLAVVLLGGSLLANMQPLSSLMRNYREARYLINPASILWSLGIALRGDVARATALRKPIGLNAHPGRLASNRDRPLRIIVVVGETVRGANWGLNGYERDTTPELRRRGVINFERVRSCGTNTEVSLPCMFAPVGRRDYDEATIRGSESLLHVLSRAGVEVRWRDNQSGCKGVCAGLPFEQVGAQDAAACLAGRCSDQLLFEGLDRFLDQPAPTALMVLHMLGNHGPSYWRRYPADRAIFQPDCRRDELSQCSRREIINAYDNGILYTDRLLAALIDQMKARSDRHDTVVMFLSDHGESLGERGLYLHGMPWAIATDEQTWVPWIMWFSPGAEGRVGIDPACLATRAKQPAQHDHLFHTLLSLAGVETAIHEPAWDLAAGCRVGQ